MTKSNISRKDEWEDEFQRWKAEKRKKEKPKIEEKPTLKIEEKEESQEPELPKHKRKPKTFLIPVLVLVVLVLGYFASDLSSSNISFTILIIALFALSLAFFLILFTHRVYEKSIYKINPTAALAFSYALIIANMFLSPKIYSLEWAFLGFLAILVIFYDFKIDSRFLILPGLILLGYIPFLLLGAQNALAETVAVYVYYFLVVGVALQIIEYFKKTQNSIEFSSFFETFISRDKSLQLISIWGIITVALIIYNRFSSVELLKWSSVYVFVLLLVLYAIAHFQEHKQYKSKSAKK